jgi:flagellin
MSVINTNITSKIAQSNLGSSQKALSTAMERLSSGLRINSAKDDSAGQAIANRMSAQISGLSQAQRNANDGISIAQTTEGALNQVNDNLQRVRELSVQATNGTNSGEDLKSIQSEINQRLDEIDRISEQTDFNGTKVLSKDSSLRVQVGANDGETISIDLKEVTSTTLGLDGFNVSGPNGTPTEVTDFKRAFGSDSTVATVALNDGKADLEAKFGAGVTVTSDTDSIFEDADGNFFAKVTIDAADQVASNSLKENGINVAAGGSEDLFIRVDPSKASVDPATNEATFSIDFAKLEEGDIQAVRTSNALGSLDDALAEVDGFRSELGAVQNRLDSAIQNLSTNETNLSSARSRIQDANFADEVSNLTRSQILQQAGTSILSQANQLPQSAVSLLG